MVISLIGYRGSGKTSVARELAERLGWDWLDADDQIAKSSGKTIREIFLEQGEPAFRELEAKTIQQSLQQDSLVLATGGGAVLNEQTRLMLSQAGPVIWLQASVEVLSSRISEDLATEDNRPNLTLQGGVEEIKKMVELREALYNQCASLIIETSTKNIVQVIDEILDQLPSYSEDETPPGGGCHS